VIAPVKVSMKFQKLLKRLLGKYTDHHTVINYESGPPALHGRRDVINVDLFAFDEVDIVSDTVLPLGVNTVDLMMSIAVLEHIRKPRVAVSEMFRCLIPDGELIICVPFIQPVHPAPDDYCRWQRRGFGSYSRIS
jgi:SAM-dependent methyltransferase